MLRAIFTIDPETANARRVLIQLTSAGTRGVDGSNLGSKRVFDAYLSSDAAGLVPINPVTADIVPTDGPTTGALVDKPITGTKASFKVLTDNVGHADVILTNAADAAVTTYFNIVDPSTGKVLTSSAITFADDTP